VVPDLNGDPHVLTVDRAIHELRRGRAVAVDSLVVAAVESFSTPVANGLRALDPHRTALLLTAERARALGFRVDSEHAAFLLPLPADIAWPNLRDVAGLSLPESGGAAGERDALLPAPMAGLAALELAKRARLVPCLLAVDLGGTLRPQTVLSLSTQDLSSTLRRSPPILHCVSRARVPLAAREDCELALFRDPQVEGDHVAVVIGTIDPQQAVRVRVHSACLTGDLLGSLRCDCGDQLRGAVERIAEGGGGILLYLAQEGRGIGLANKLRAYALQDTGLDTFDADMSLGFSRDERSFRVAAAMLGELGVRRVCLLTNNPEKVRTLGEAGVEVVAREPLGAELNRHNSAYVHTKQTRAGHYPIHEECEQKR
jgi:GTP cyclohydrolase II